MNDIVEQQQESRAVTRTDGTSSAMLAMIADAARDPTVDAQKMVTLADLAIKLQDREQAENYRDAQRNGRRPTKVANDILQFQAGREAAIAAKLRDRRKSKEWLEGYDQVAKEGKAEK